MFLKSWILRRFFGIWIFWRWKVCGIGGVLVNIFGYSRIKLLILYYEDYMKGNVV